MERRILMLRIIMIIIFGSAMCFSTSAQTYVAPAVTISKDKVKIDGKVFYSHIVLEKQTLYSISKAYNVSIDDIYKYNPAIKENGLRKNDILNIPVMEVVQQQKPVEVIGKAEVEPTQQQPEPEPQVQQTNNGGIQHKVKWYEDLGSIAAKYGVSQDAIMKANGMKDSKVKSRQILTIPPMNEYAAATSEESTAANEAETDDINVDIEENNNIEQYASDSTFIEDFFAHYWKAPVNATLILPFKATGKTSSKNHMDLYSGVLLASKEMKENNIEVHLNVFDIAANVSNIPAEALRLSDLIIGPVSTEDITKICNISGGNIPIISPLDQKVEKLASSHTNLIQAPASQYAQFNDIAQWVKEDAQIGDRIIVIYEKEARQNDGGRVLRAIIDMNEVKYTPFSYSILEGRDIQGRLEGIMTTNGINRVVIASESEAFVNDAVRNLNLIVHNKIPVILYAPAKIRTFETIEVENLHNTSLHASLTYNIDYDNKMVQDFIRKYRAMFGTEPTQFAYQGYDLAKYFIGLASKYQKGWMLHLEEENADMLQNTFKFTSTPEGGYINNGIRRIIYGKDYQIEEVL